MLYLVNEYNDVLDSNLFSKQQMLSSLWHCTICCSNNQYSAIHLCCSCDHVFNVIGMTWAICMSIMTIFCLVLNVCNINGNSASFFFRGIVNLAISLSCC